LIIYFTENNYVKGKLTSKPTIGMAQTGTFVMETMNPNFLSNPKNLLNRPMPTTKKALQSAISIPAIRNARPTLLHQKMI